MAEYTLRVQDSEGRIAKITPLVGSIVASGLYSSPTTLNGDNTYGFDIDLPGTDPIKLANLAVVTKPNSWSYGGYIFTIGYGTTPNMFYTMQYFAHSSMTYYTMSGGIMSLWSAGNLTLGDPNTWDKTFTFEPIVYWLANWTLGTTTAVRIFPAVMYMVVDYSAGAFFPVYSLYGVPSTSFGISSSIVSVVIKEWDY
jgi:hypothetical protein